MVRRRELRARHARANDDKPLGHLVEVIDLIPGEDALPIGLRAIEDAGPRPRRDQDDVGIQGHLAVRGRREHPRGGLQTSPTLDVADSVSGQPGFDVPTLGGSQLLDPLVDRCQVDTERAHTRSLAMHADPQRSGFRGHSKEVGGGDQGLAGHAVGQHCRAARALGVDDGHRGAELRCHERGLVAAGSRSNDDH